MYLRDTATKVNQSSKLRPIWKGPFLVVMSKTPLYRIQGHKKFQFVHHDRLKMCYDRNILGWLKRLRHSLLQTDSVEEPESFESSEEPGYLSTMFHEEESSIQDEGPVEAEDSSSEEEREKERDSETVSHRSRTGRQRKMPTYLRDYICH